MRRQSHNTLTRQEKIWINIIIVVLLMNATIIIVPRSTIFLLIAIANTILTCIGLIGLVRYHYDKDTE